MPEKKLISPDFLFDHAWEYQGRLTVLQEEINEAIQEVQTVVSRVLKVSTAKTLKQYQVHIGAVESEYAPHIEAFEQLIPGDCKDSASSILNNVIRFTGFDASNCAESYDISVRGKVANASNSLVRFDDVFSQIQLIVIKAFVGRNAFVTPEAIEDKISEIYKIARRITHNAQFDSEIFLRNLASEIAEENVELGNCHNSILEVAASQFSWFRNMVQTCLRFENSGASDRTERMARTADPHVQLLQEFQEQFAKLKYYQWKA